MYTLVNITVRLKREWLTLEVNHQLIKDLLFNYGDSFINVLEDDNTIYTQFNIKDLLNVHSILPTIYIDDYINNFDGILTPEVSAAEQRGLDKVRRITYHAIWDLDLTTNRGFYTPAPSENDPIHYFPDIKITKAEGQVNTLANLNDKLLFMVNGRVFFHTLLDEEAWLIGATAELDKGFDKQISALDFTYIGGYERIIFEIGDVALRSKTDSTSVVTITSSVSLKDKTPLLVIDGRLLLMDDTYQTISDTKIRATIQHDRLVALAEHRDAASLGWVLPATIDGIGYDLSTVDIVAALTNGRSGIIIVDTDALCIFKQTVGRTGFRGRYEFYRLPDGILQLEDGTIGDYVVTSTSSFSVEISTTEPHSIQRISDTVSNELSEITDNQRSLTGNYNSIGKMIDLYTL